VPKYPHTRHLELRVDGSVGARDLLRWRVTVGGGVSFSFALGRGQLDRQRLK